MLKRIPAAVLHDAPAWPKPTRALFLGLMMLGLVVAQTTLAQRVVDMPQSRSFTDAYQTALTLSQEFPGSRLMTVASTYSMYPTIDWDSIVIVVPTTLDRINVGDVVCFRDKRLDGAHTILHRVEKILVKDRRLVTRGDHLERADPHPVQADALVGKAVYVVYFDRIGERRSVDHILPTPTRREQVMRL